MSDDRETLSPRPRKQQTRELIAESDWVKLGGQKEFLRTLFTVLHTAGMYTGNYHSDGRNHAFYEGRRSLGLDILRTAEKYLGADVHISILEAENTTLKEAPSGRSRTDDRDDRSDGYDPVPDTGRGLAYLDYGSDDSSD